MPRKSKLTPFHDLIGQVPDREIAVMAEVSIATVCHYRQRHSIPSFRSTLSASTLAASTPLPTPETAPAEPATAPPEPVTAVAGPLQGFLAVVEAETGTREWYLIASGMPAAAVIASQAGRVLKLSYLGPALG